MGVCKFELWILGLSDNSNILITVPEMIKSPAKVKAEENVYITETERSSGWLPCSSLEARSTG